MGRIKIADNPLDCRWMALVMLVAGLVACTGLPEQPQYEETPNTASLAEPVAMPVPVPVVEQVERTVSASTGIAATTPAAPVETSGPETSTVLLKPKAAFPESGQPRLPAGKKQPLVLVPALVKPVTPAALPGDKIIIPEKKPVQEIQSAIQPVDGDIDKSLVSKTAMTDTVDKKVGALRGSVQGSVVILGKNSEKLKPDNVVVSLEPLFNMADIPVKPRVYSIDMKDKRYLPSVVAIRPGDKVNFHNRDPIKHNVFSSSGNNAFDLGTYGLGVTQGVSFRYPGIVKVYCNIHPEMATFIAIENKGYTYITKADGRFSFNDVPAGEYLLKIWHVRGETRKRFSVGAGKVAQNNITLDTTTFELVPHLNKHGKSYQVKPTLFKDEFY